MSKSIYEEVLEMLRDSLEESQYGGYDGYVLDPEQLSDIAKAVSQAKEQKGLLELYDKLAEHRLIVINYLLNEIMELADFETAEEFIDFVMREARYLGEVDAKITDAISETEGLEK